MIHCTVKLISIAVIIVISSAAAYPQPAFIDAAIQWNNNIIYFFNGGMYLPYNIQKDYAEYSYPAAITGSHWPGLWSSGCDAALNYGNGKACFFKGSRYIRFDIAVGKIDEGYPKPINDETWPGLWPSGVDAAVNRGNGKVYFFKGSQYVRWDIAAGKTDPGYPLPINRNTWPGLWTSGIDAAFNRGNGKVYFFRGNQYMRYDIAAEKVDKRYPLLINEQTWPGIVFHFRYTLEDFFNEDVKPGISPDYAFPLSHQYKNGCFAFGINHIITYKYGKNIDLYKAEKKIKKTRHELWTVTHIENFLNEYNLTLSWDNNVSAFFHHLIKGEPLLIQYKKYSTPHFWVGHFVAAYSFDRTGLWISESVSVRRLHLTYDQVFDSSGSKTQFHYATVLWE
jgi:hypothetical protein